MRLFSHVFVEHVNRRFWAGKGNAHLDCFVSMFAADNEADAFLSMARALTGRNTYRRHNIGLTGLLDMVSLGI